MSSTPNTKHEFFQQIINRNNISFTDEETILLNKGFKYCFKGQTNKNSLIKELLQAETAINTICDDGSQNHATHTLNNNAF